MSTQEPESVARLQDLIARLEQARAQLDATQGDPEQAVDVRVALAASTDGAGADVREGMTADLAVVELDPTAASVDDLRRMPVALTLLGGRITHGG